MKKMIISLVLAVVCFSVVAGGKYWYDYCEEKRIKKEYEIAMMEHRTVVENVGNILACFIGATVAEVVKAAHSTSN